MNRCPVRVKSVNPCLSYRNFVVLKIRPYAAGFMPTVFQRVPRLSNLTVFSVSLRLYSAFPGGNG
jgi:hypothetical protein